MKTISCCLHCGGRAEIKIEREQIGFGGNDVKYYVACTNCGIRTKGYGYLDSNTETARIGCAIDDWNKELQYKGEINAKNKG